MAEAIDLRERERLAMEAKRLTNDLTLIKALEAIRQTAVDRLVKADASIMADVMRHQAVVKVCDDFMVELETMIQVHSIETASH